MGAQYSTNLAQTISVSLGNETKACSMSRIEAERTEELFLISAPKQLKIFIR